MKSPLRIAAAALFATPLVLAAQTPAPTKAPASGASDPGKRFTGVHMQQGRVQTDADWNDKLQACKRQNEALKKQLKARANDLEIQLRKLEAAADAGGENKKGSQDHKKAMKDAIRKMLDQIAEINRASQL